MHLPWRFSGWCEVLRFSRSVHFSCPVNTHVFLWWREDSPRLHEEARERIANADVVLLSAVSAWEIVIKLGLGKIRISGDLEEVFDPPGFGRLPLTDAHALALPTLPSHHRDPFDRMLIAQARVERLTIVTHDCHVEAYPVTVVWT